ncbi:MAG: ketopantoate reductase family protein [Chloroflexota bacterium]
MGTDPIVFGAGALGGFLAARLGSADQQVGLVARPAVSEAITSDGLMLREPSGESVSHPRIAQPADRTDLLILTVRASDVARALDSLTERLTPAGVVLAMQNGVGSEDLLAEKVGRDRVLIGTATTRVTMPAPGRIERHSNGGLALSSMGSLPVPPEVVALFRQTGLTVQTIPDYRSLRWSKLILNLLGVASSAILDMDPAEVARDPDLFRLELRVVREAAAVAGAQRIPLTSLPGYPVPLLRQVLRLPRPLAQAVLVPRLAAARGDQSPGLRSDLARGRTEVDYLHGAVARGGSAARVATPTCSALNDLLHRLIEDPSLRANLRHNPGNLLRHIVP